MSSGNTLARTMHASRLLKHNIDALLRGRHQTRHDLAQWCRRSDPWLSKILSESPGNNQSRSVPLKYLDRIADFFGIATYQLFQPGISGLTERRSGRDRRTGLDRRISQAEHGRLPQRMPDMETVTPGERALLARIRRLKYQRDREMVDRLVDGALLAQDAEPNTTGLRDPHDADGPPVETAPRTRKQRHA